MAQLAAATMVHSSRGVAQSADESESSLKTDAPLDRLVDELEKVVTAAMARLDVPGLSVALIRDAQIAWTKSFGVKNRATAQPVDDSTVFEVASLTKPCLAYVALALCKKGQLDLDQPLAKHLPEPYTNQQPELLAQVTARHVLTHTTGFPNWRLPGRPLKFLRPPGQKFSYSGEGFVYLQRVVEHLTNKPLDELLQEWLFGPLKMSSASLVWKDDFDQTLARGYSGRADGPSMLRKWSKPNAASSLVCTAADYARFTCALLAPPAGGEKLLAASDIKQMCNPLVEAADGISWGLGIGIEHTPSGDAFWHWGNNASRYNSFVVGFPDQQIGLVILTNSGSGLKACVDMVPAALGGVHPALGWKMVVGVG